MQQLRTGHHTKLTNTPIYELDPNTFKICFLNSRSLHKHIEDIRSDLNYSNMDINIFSETRLYHLDSNASYAISGYTIFRNDSESAILTTRPFSGTAVYTKIPFKPGYPLAKNTNGVEITIIKVVAIPHVNIIGVYRSPKVSVQQMCLALTQILNSCCSDFNVFLGDFNVNYLIQKEKVPLNNLFIREKNYRQLVSSYTTDNRTTIDHIYTNLPESQVTVHILETYFTDHKAICALIKT